MLNFLKILFISYVLSLGWSADWDALTMSSSFPSACYWNLTRSLEFSNFIVKFEFICPVTTSSEDDNLNKGLHCSSYLYPVRLQKNGDPFRYDSCNKLPTNDVIRQVSSQDGTLAMLTVSLDYNSQLQYLDLVVLDTCLEAEKRNYIPMLGSLRQISNRMSLLTFAMNRVLPSTLIGTDYDMQEYPILLSEPLTKIRVLRVCSLDLYCDQRYMQASQSSPKGNSFDNNDFYDDSDEFTFHRLNPFLALHEKSTFEVKLFAPFRNMENFHVDNLLNDVVFLDSILGIPMSEQLLYLLEYRAWFHSLDYFISGAWHPATSTEHDTQLFKLVIQQALHVIDFFRGFDIIIYEAVGWATPSQISMLVNLMWLARTPKLVRYVTADDSFREQFGHCWPADALLADSRAYESQVSIKFVDVDDVVVDDDYV